MSSRAGFCLTTGLAADPPAGRVAGMTTTTVPDPFSRPSAAFVDAPVHEAPSRAITTHDLSVFDASMRRRDLADATRAEYRRYLGKLAARTQPGAGGAALRQGARAAVSGFAALDLRLRPAPGRGARAGDRRPATRGPVCVGAKGQGRAAAEEVRKWWLGHRNPRWLFPASGPGWVDGARRACCWPGWRRRAGSRIWPGGNRRGPGGGARRRP
jgi:hypothetical protein